MSPAILHPKEAKQVCSNVKNLLIMVLDILRNGALEMSCSIMTKSYSPCFFCAGISGQKPHIPVIPHPLFSPCDLLLFPVLKVVLK
jgi:hypothetical protein